MRKYRRPMITALAVLAVLMIMGPAGAEILEMDITSENDSEAVVTISLDTAPNQVRSFLFEVHYDSGALSFKSLRFKDLLNNFTPKHGYAPEQGRLIVGGLDYLTQVGILRGASGPLVEITFAKSDRRGLGRIEVNLLKDDMAGWMTRSITDERVAFVAGDLNNNQTIGLEDIIVGLKILVDIDPGIPVFSDQDINGNKKIDIAEVLFLLQKLSGIR